MGPTLDGPVPLAIVLGFQVFLGFLDLALLVVTVQRQRRTHLGGCDSVAGGNIKRSEIGRASRWVLRGR